MEHTKYLDYLKLCFSSPPNFFSKRYKCTHEEDQFRKCDGDWQMAADRICGNLSIDMDNYFVGYSVIFIKVNTTSPSF